PPRPPPDDRAPAGPPGPRALHHPLAQGRRARDRGQRRADPGRREHERRDGLLLAHGGPVKAKIWGARGSVPSPGPETTRYGGNTSCVQITLSDGTILALDAGTGIRSM